MRISDWSSDVCSSDLSDAGGVSLHLKTPAAVREAVEAMSRKPAIAAARVEGWLVEEMIPAGQEVVVGGFRDPQFGPMIMVRSEDHTSGLQSLMSISYAVFCLKKQIAHACTQVPNCHHDRLH